MASSSPYAPAAQLLQQIWTQHKSLKTLAYDKNGNLRCNKATYAQVCHVLQHKSMLDTVVQRVSIGNVRNEGLLYVLLYELLLGPNLKIRGGGALKRQVMAKEKELRRVLLEVQHSQNDDTATPSSSVVTFPRYVRINTLQTDTNQVIKTLVSQNHESLFVDEHVPNLLVMFPGSLSAQDALVQSGKLILQDKSSCFSALCLIHGNASIPFEGDCLDACAAPGNKTSHLAALLGNSDTTTTSSRQVYALDRSSTRVATLKRRMNLFTCNNNKNVHVVTQHLDFLTTTPSDYPNTVRGILLDPSCSGSGMFTSLDNRLNNNNNNETPNDGKNRITSLSNFQLTALKHCMSFPQVERIVYSTCSLHEQENECVVSQALQHDKNNWMLVAPACLQNWKRRGKIVNGISREEASFMIRANREDETNGFFVAYLERKSLVDKKASKKRKALPAPATRISGLPVYNGEFAKETSSTGNDESSVSKVSSPPKSKTDSKPPVVNKKRAKKLAWKRRQMEQKLRRIEKKNAKKELD